MEYYSSCNVLPLKIFFAIAESGNTRLLLIANSNIESSILFDAWEDIMIEYADLDNNVVIKDVFDTSTQIAINIAKYVEVNAMLLYLEEVEYKQEYIDRLKVLGYNIKNEDYITDIGLNQRKVTHIITRIKILQNEIEHVTDVKNKSSFDQSLAWISANLNFWPPDDITVSRYLELKKQVIQRQAKAK